MASNVTPSPSPPHRTASVSRRPPRKSTLTQQQKNQKRQRATQDQLVTLEAEFNKNPTPTAVVRERIALEINMTERSVQIWFQNKRAKIKTMAKKSLETGEECDQIPESMRQYLAMQAMESGKGFARGYAGDRPGMSAYGNGNMFLAPEPSSQGKIVIQHFSCRSLSIGSWRRVGQNSMDLIVFYSPEKACLTYYINNDHAGFKIEFPFSYIKDISLEQLDTNSPSGQKQGQLVISLSRTPNFFMDSSMDSSGSGGFRQVGDFTENRQASQVFTHYLGGQHDKLADELQKLLVLDCFANRHQMTLPLYQMDAPNLTVSAPVSPHIVRPASSNDVHHYQQEVAPGHQFHQKHRRTRSRSVPAAIDFSQMGMPSFSFQDHGHNDHLYAPAPQHTHSLVAAPMGNPLRIDTTAQYLDYRPGSASYPLSATTASPSDYASPSMINPTLHQENGYGTPYSLPYLSPMQDPAQMANPSISPISMTDPIIASGSPPLTHLERSASAELYPNYSDNGLLTDDLNEMYSKQTLNMHGSPHMDPIEAEALDMQQLMQFNGPMSAHLSDNGTPL